jgi:c-di-GMP-related signal transduction protein
MKIEIEKVDGKYNIVANACCESEEQILSGEKSQILIESIETKQMANTLLTAIEDAYRIGYGVALDDYRNN